MRSAFVFQSRTYHFAFAIPRKSTLPATCSAGEFGAARALWVKKGDDGNYAVEPVELPDMTAEGNLMLALVEQTPWWQENLKALPF